jgi:hypothetical protein
MDSNYFNTESFCDGDNAPIGFSHRQVVKKLCIWCSKLNPQWKQEIKSEQIEEIDLTNEDSPDPKQKLP